MLEATKPLASAALPAEQHPADEGYVPPVSSVVLPSRGIVYPPESPLYLCEAVDIKPVTANEEDILSSTTLIKKGIVMTALMRACITNRRVDPEKMLVGDRNAILTAIRVSAYGPTYSCTMVCPACAETVEYAFDLSHLKLDPIGAEPVSGPGSNDFTFLLPESQKVAHFKLLNAEEVNLLEKDIEGMRKKGQEKGVTLRLQHQVTAVDGVDPKQLRSFLASMRARDSRALRSYMDEISPGVDMKQEFECSACAHKEEVEIPVGLGFFWPTSVE